MYSFLITNNIPVCTNILDWSIYDRSNIFGRNVYKVILYVQDVPNQVCTEMQSPQQLLYNLYNTVALTEIKGYTMIQFSYMLLRLYNKGTWYRQSRLNVRPTYSIFNVAICTEQLRLIFFS